MLEFSLHNAFLRTYRRCNTEGRQLQREKREKRNRRKIEKQKNLILDEGNRDFSSRGVDALEWRLQRRLSMEPVAAGGGYGGGNKRQEAAPVAAKGRFAE